MELYMLEDVAKSVHVTPPLYSRGGGNDGSGNERYWELKDIFNE